MTFIAIETKEALIQKRELERLKRYLFIKFGKKAFDMFWTTDSTSYTDYKGIYVKYDLQTSQHRLFSEDELRLLRKTHAIHERGHIQYDIGGVTHQWIKDNASSDQIDWKNNVKYPEEWLRYFAGMMIDVRMEYYVALGLPESKTLFEFTNEHWRFGIRGLEAGTCRINDFRECIASRGFQLKDLEWHTDAIKLADQVTDILTSLRESKSTVDCMDHTLQLVQAVWPTLYDWLELNDFKPNLSISNYDSESWGDKAEVEKNIEEILQAAEEQLNQEDIDPADKDKLLKQLKKEILEDEQLVEDEIKDYEDRKETVEIDLPKIGESVSEAVTIKPYRHQNLHSYNQIKNELKKSIARTSKELKKILAPEEDILLTNQRSGHLDISEIWSALKTDNSNIFRSEIKGSDGINARTFIMNDISGSTSMPFGKGTEKIIDVMKQSLILLNEVCEQIKLPLEIFAFTETRHTEIYPLKPFNKSTNLEKSFIGAIKAEEGNRDSLALQWIINRAQNYVEELRIIFMISDGLPTFSKNEDLYTIRNMVQVANKKGIDVVCLFIGNPRNFNQVKTMYPGHAILVTNNLQRDLINQLTKIIKKRKGIH